jgi:two-component system phosphate regulon sensor histidine kinase PhoR
VISIGRDISDRMEKERLQGEQIARLQELDRMKSAFVGMVSHELRTPLTSIKGYAEFLEDGIGGSLTDPQQEFVTQIARSAHRLEAVVNDLLDFARIDARNFKLHLAEADVAAEVREVLESFGPQLQEAGLVLETFLPGSPLRARVDAQRIAQVVLNLVSNAIKFTGAGGRVFVRLTAVGGRLRCEVMDTGIGIAQEDLPKLFRRFSQLDNRISREAGGTGLGLSISKVIVEGHGGTIGVESEPGRGSTFWFELPGAR